MSNRTIMQLNNEKEKLHDRILTRRGEIEYISARLERIQELNQNDYIRMNEIEKYIEKVQNKAIEEWIKKHTPLS